ncbi:SDR family oxidoreductase [Sutcliffiella halmapala]|uniref:SDR family oxidoreductase n=1 Tax=Sutcliffiella halmapala TaxID=79882 RepID=UPI000995B759|nr:SDR family oxidoreductase [Sutcliffiella halmapala]
MNLPFQVNLSGKVVVITGGSGVLGSSFSEALAKCGAKIAIIGRSKEKVEHVASRIIENGGEALGISANVLDKSELEVARELIHQKFGTCDILINGAGGNHAQGTTDREFFEKGDLQKDFRTFFDLDEAGINYVFQLNFLGTLLPSQVFGRDMVEKERGTIVNISSMNAFTPLTKIPAYSGAKAAVSNFTQWLAVHMSKAGVRVNAIAPGFFLTEQNRTLLQKEDGSYTERAEKIISQTPMGRFGEGDELIGTLLWLVNEQASGFVNGIVVPVDGGFSAYSGV